MENAWKRRTDRLTAIVEANCIQKASRRCDRSHGPAKTTLQYSEAEPTTNLASWTHSAVLISRASAWN